MWLLKDWLFKIFGWEVDYDKVIAELREQITDKYSEIKILERQISEAILAKRKQNFQNKKGEPK